MRWRSTFRGWPRPARWAAYVAAGLVLLLVVAAVAGVSVVRRPLPQTSGELEVPGLTGRVEVVRDEHGIPQVYADSMDDLMMAQGYVQAQERFFEMDVRRHVTAGRLSELFGEETLETDKVIRTMGWRRVAERELALIEPRTRQALEAYADGVNAYLAEHGTSELAAEYSLLRLGGLDYVPEDWTPVDSLAWLKAMAWDLRGNMEDEIGRVLAGVDHTDAEVAQLYPPYPFEEHPPIVAGGAVVDGVFDQDATGGTRHPERPPAAYGDALAEVSDALEDLPSLVGRGDGIGSNSWVVGPERTTTGGALLANDPHLGVSLPGIWMQMGLHCRTVSAECPMDVAGFTFSGVPGVIIGHNADIAWGFTNLGPDVTDLFLERVRDSDWRYDKQWRPMEVRTETIEVRDGDDVELRVRATDHGPLLSDVSEELSTVGANAVSADETPDDVGVAVALSWTALQPTATADAILELNLATGWDEFREAAARLRGAGAEHGVRRPRGSHRLPGTGADPDPAVRQRRVAAGGGLASRERLDRAVHPVRRAAERARPRGGLRGRGEPGGRRARLPVVPHRRLGPGLPVDADPEPHRGRPAAVRRRDGRAPERRPQPDGRAAGALPARRRRPRVRLLPRRPGPAAVVGLPPARRQRRRGVLQRGVAGAARPDLPRRAARVAVARGRAAVVRGGDRPAGRPDRELVGRRGDRGRRWRPATTCCAWR